MSNLFIFRSNSTGALGQWRETTGEAACSQQSTDADRGCSSPPEFHAEGESEITGIVLLNKKSLYCCTETLCKVILQKLSNS